MLKVLKLIGVEPTRYHGGSLAGMDIKKVIGNASFVFDEFAKILKDEARKNNHCTLSDDDIDHICDQHKEVYLLWDGAFSTARTINPTEDDRSLYCRFVNAAVHCHVKLGCSVTHKVHLMHTHVVVQMKIPGGLGEKMEDWVELQHQSGSRDRRRYRTTKDIAIRATARARKDWRGTNPSVMAQRELVKEEGKRIPKTNDDVISVEIARKAEREAKRIAALEAFEQKKYAAVKLRRWWLRRWEARLVHDLLLLT